MSPTFGGMTTPDEYPDEPGAGRFYDPAAAAFIAFPLAMLCLFGSTALTGITYTLMLVNPLDSGGDGVRAYLVAGYVLSALFAVLPLALGRVGLSRLVASDAWWLAPLLRAAVAIALLAVVLRMASAVLVLVSDNYGWAGLLPVRV